MSNKNISEKNRREIIDKLKQDLISLDTNFDKKEVKDKFLKLQNDVNDIINDIKYEIDNKKNKNLKKQPKSYSKSQQQSEQKQSQTQEQKQSQIQEQKQSQTQEHQKQKQKQQAQQPKPETKKQETNERGFFSGLLEEIAPGLFGLVLSLPIILIFKKDPKTGANIKG